jgi:peptidoglycan/LPS O-acetylase OafA/YrhL
MKSRLVSVQALRGLAALLVVFAHFIEHGGIIKSNAILITGRFGVEIFFVISGFIIARVLGDEPFKPGAFAIRRIFRIVPLYWACTLLTFAAAFVAGHAFKSTMADFPSLMRSLLFIPTEVAGRPGDWRPLYKLGWTLNYEMFFYAVALAFFWMNNAVKRAGAISAIMLVLVVISFFIEPRASVLAFYANIALIPFVAGLWIAEADRRGLIAKHRAIFAPAAVVIAIGATIVLYGQPFSSLRTLGPHLVMTASCIGILVAALASEALFRGRIIAVANFLGDSSYSLYLLHMFGVGAAWALARRLDLNGAPLFGLMFVAFAGCLIAAHLSYRLFETPLNKAAGRLTAKPKPQPHGGQPETRLAEGTSAP